MNITLISLEALILKATNESLPCPDAAALEAFCAIMKDSAEGPQLGAQALAARVHSASPKEALLALAMLDRCLRRNDPNFQAEVGKFRFLNELIKLVSPKYFAGRTAPEVRMRVLQLFHAWSIEYPKESKFKVAYDMLKNQGVIKETPPPLPPEDAFPPPRPKNAIFEDEEKSKLLQKLLQSKKPEDLQHANRLIKTMVREEERRSEASSRCSQEVGAALNNAELLREMVAAGARASRDERALMAELHARCARLRTLLARRAAAAPAPAPQHLPNNIEDIIHATDMLNEVCELYNTFVMEDKPDPRDLGSLDQESRLNGGGGDSLLDLAGCPPPRGDTVASSNALDELGDIFASQGTTSIAELLKPVNLLDNNDVELLGETSGGGGGGRGKAEAEGGWGELDSLGEQLLQQALPDRARRLDGFNSKTTKKIPMNSIETTPKPTSSPDAILDLDFFTQTPTDTKQAEPPSSNEPDDLMVDISTSSNRNDEDTNKCDKQDSDKVEVSEVQSLADIEVSLESVTPSAAPPVTVFEERGGDGSEGADGGVSVTLHVCAERPRPGVRVLVVSTVNNKPVPIEDYKFHAVVPKGCKARLVGGDAASGGARLPARRPFLPAPAQCQLLLVSAMQDIPLKCFISYRCQGETHTDIQLIDKLPFSSV